MPAITLRRTVIGVLLTAAVAAVSRPAVGPLQAQPGERPNIVLIVPDNLGWGEVGVYGSVRGSFTPRIDKLAAEGIRLTNYNVEFSCVVSRAALLTGRYAVRTGATQATGMTLWEITMAEALKGIGYATGLFGKWHLGGNRPEGQREPSHQGFDEFYGIPRTSNESLDTRAFGGSDVGSSFVWEGAAGVPSRNVKVFDIEARRTVDRESADRAIAFAERAVKNRQPFFLYYPMTQVHFPTFAPLDVHGSTGAGDLADAMVDVDRNVGRVLDALDRLKVARNTIVLWCPDNGAEERRPWRGSPGPWNGFYNTVMEGGIRVPCIIRWPGRIPAGRVTNALVHQIDLFPTFAAAVAADIVPADRAIDGVNQLPLLEGRRQTSGREHILLHTNTRLSAVKWHDWKFYYTFPGGAATAASAARVFNLLSDPREEFDVKDANPWMRSVADRIAAEFTATTAKYPHVPPGAADPYVPPGKQ